LQYLGRLNTSVFEGFFGVANMAIVFTQIGLHVDLKVEKQQNLLYFWLPTGTHHKNMVIWIFFEIWLILAIFP
jgi:hypothetical protein